MPHGIGEVANVPFESAEHGRNIPWRSSLCFEKTDSRV